MAAAYEILSDSQSRESYDMYGIEGLAGAGRGSPHGMDASELFAQFFRANEGMFGFDSGPGMGPGRRRGKGEDSLNPYDVTLEDLYNGKSVKMNMEKEVLCGQCKGSGARGNAKPKACPTCEGKGWTYIQTHISSHQMGTSRSQCRDCKGLGEKLKEKDRCKKCKGEKVVTEKTRQEIFIEKGMADRQRIVLAGAGDQEPGIPAGDVVFILKASPHESFERSGNDLLTHVTITLSEALFGFSRILLTHLDGRGIRVTSPPGKIIQHGESIILRGEGMPIYKQAHEKGDLYAIIAIEMPDDEWLRTVDQRSLLTLLPSKKLDVDPLPAIVDEVDFEASDIVDFGDDDEDAWADEEEDDGGGGEPECRPQ